MAVQPQYRYSVRPRAKSYVQWLFLQRVADLLWGGAVLLELLLASHLLFMLSAAPLTGFPGLVHALSHPLVAIFKAFTVPAAEAPVIMAMMVYGLIAWLLIKVLRVFACHLTDQTPVACDSQLL